MINNRSKNNEAEAIRKALKERIIRNFLDILVMIELENEALSGYDLMNRIFEKLNFLPSPGTIYSLLYALERKELVKGISGRKKRLYILTEKGKFTVKTVVTEPYIKNCPKAFLKL
ncbi:MAG: PadR family transcriptional regulator [Candidatus Bathyarchaeota archaeon]|nr:PadR family transcriptional regulator [Candidatus Bathyarchaeota archaeon]